MADAPQLPSSQEDIQANDGSEIQPLRGLTSESGVFFNERIHDAIAAAQTGKKVLLVYIAGDDEDSKKLDQITWQDLKVRQVVSQQFVTLRLQHQSVGALHFSAMYPYNEVPTIALINHNGLLLKKHGGYVSPSEFLISLESAAAMLHLQNAAAMVAALASTSVGSSTPMNLEGSGVDLKESLTKVENPEPEEASPSMSFSDSGTSGSGAFQSGDSGANSLENNAVDQTEDPLSVPTNGPCPASLVGQTCAMSTVSKLPSNQTASESVATSQVSEILTLGSSDKVAPSEVDETEGSSSECNLPAGKKNQSSGSVLLRVKLTNGESLIKSFNVKDPLAVVKVFVDNNRTDGNASYSLALAYPRKIFDNKDMERSLVELNLEDRATLILVTRPSQEACMTVAEHSSQTSTSQMTGASSDGAFWKFLSYLNPFAYFSRGPSGANDTQPGSSSWQYAPDSTFARSIQNSSSDSRDGKENMVGPSNSHLSVPKATKKARNGPEDKGWGGNIHTLQHDDDSEVFKRGNAFWNGNSTQYGGDDSKKS